MKNQSKKLFAILMVLCIMGLSIFLFNGSPANQFVNGTNNAPKALKLESVYGDTQATHPKVLYFEKPWNGYSYWMTFTPYPEGDDSKENPHILASQNGIDWDEPKGFRNPLDDTPDAYERSVCYNSDSHLLYNEQSDELECWWRYVDDHEDIVVLFRRCSSDGINWTPKEEMVKRTRSKEDYVSLAILFEDNVYKMWYVSGYQIQYRESTNGRDWSDYVTKEVSLPDEALRVWHLDAIHTKQGYEMVFCAFDHRLNDARQKMSLYYTSSTDNENYRPAIEILRPLTGINTWDNCGLYRSSLVYNNEQYYLYYSGIKDDKTRGVGLCTARSMDDFRIIERTAGIE